MRRGFLIARLCCLAQVASLGAVGLARAETGATPDAPAASPPPQAVAMPKAAVSPDAAGSPEFAGSPESAGSPEAAATAETPAAAPQPVAAAPPPLPPHPVVAIIRDKLADPDIRKDAAAADIAALEAFYGAWSGAPLWITEMGFSARAQSALFEIEKADDWGLDAKAFALPAAGALPPNDEAQALASISDLLDQAPPLRDPQEVMTEIGMTRAPDAYLRALHPSHEQFRRLHQALLDARDQEKEDAKLSATDIKRVIVNMERWRWMPEELGPLYV